MDNYIVRKEYFGGLISEVKKYTIHPINNIEYEVIKSVNKVKKDNRIRIVESPVHCNNSLIAPLSITIYPSLNCNSNCSFCFVNSIKEKYKHEMTYQDFCLIIDQAKTSGVFDIEIMGGEPFLIPWILNAIEYISNKGIHCSINTNGMLLTKIIIQKLFEIKNLSLRVSVQDNYKQLNAYIRNILSWCEEYGLRVDVLTVLQKENYNTLKYLILNLPDNIIKNIIILYNNPPVGKIPSYDVNWYYSVTNEIIKFAESNSTINVVAKGPFGHRNKKREEGEHIQYIDGRCLASISRFEILPNGDVIPCVKYYCSDKYILGNAFKEGLLSIWNNNKTHKFRNTITQNCKKTSSCNKCKWATNCSGCIGYAKGLNLKFDNRCPNF